MKRIFVILLCLTMCISICSCNNSNINDMPPVDDSTATTGDSTSVTVDTDSVIEDSTTVTEDTDIDTTPDIGDDTTVEPPLTEAEIKEIIDQNLDILMTNSENFTSEREYIDTHPEAFAEIVALGEAALTYLDEVSFKAGNHYIFDSTESHRSLIAKTAAYAINPELYDIITESSDGKYSIALRVGTFFYPEWGGGLITAYNKLEIIDHISNEIILSERTDSREYGQYTNVSVEWSPDNAYAAIISHDNKFYSTIEIYDVNNAAAIPLPSFKDSIIPQVISELNLSDDIHFDYTSISLDGWQENDAVTVNFWFRCGIAFIAQGTYVYNISEQSIISITCELSEDITTVEPNLTEAEIKEIIDNNLDIILSGGELFFSEQEYIDAHPEAFAEIVSLGEGALTYLLESAKNIQIYDESTENHRRIMARAAAYAIKPELYDQVFPSPDGNYVLKATVKSFFTLIDPFAGVSYKLSVVDKNNSILIHEDGGYSITDLTGNECLEWSPDSRYVFLKQSYRHYYTTISVFSMESNEFFDLPGETQIEELVGENLSLYDSELGSELSYFHFAIEEWYNDDIIRVSIELSNNAGRYLEAGYYQYNLADQQIMDIQIYK